MSDDKDTELADTLAEVGRRLGQALSDGLDRLRSARDAVADAANRPEVRAVHRVRREGFAPPALPVHVRECSS